MSISRREFGRGLTSGVVGWGALSSLPALGADPEAKESAGKGFTRFFQHPTFEIIFLTALGRAYHAGGNVGKVLYLAGQVKDGDFEGAFLAFRGAGDEARALAEESLQRRHREGYALWKQKLYFRPDWEKVITPVVDYALTRKEVDPQRIAIQGISQGGYWVPRAAKWSTQKLLVHKSGARLDLSTAAPVADASLPSKFRPPSEHPMVDRRVNGQDSYRLNPFLLTTFVPSSLRIVPTP